MSLKQRLRVASQRDPLRELAEELAAEGMTEQELHRQLRTMRGIPQPAVLGLFNAFRDVKRGQNATE